MIKHRKPAILLLGTVLYAFLFSTGWGIEHNGSIFPAFLIRFTVALPLFALMLFFLLEGGSRLIGFFALRTKPGRFHLIPAFFLIFLAWVPMLLVYYPGSFMYDTQYQTFLIARNSYDMIHPLLHTLLLRLSLSLLPLLGTIEHCALFYSLLQMVLLAGCFACVCKLISCQFPLLGWISCAFFALYPSHMAMASNCIKDVLFSGFFVLFLALALYMENPDSSPSRWLSAAFVLSGMLACLFRNNMVYAMLLWGIVLYCFKKYRRFSLLAILCVLLSFGVNTGLKTLLHAKAGDRVELFSVPIQQLSRAYLEHPEAFSSEDIDELNYYFPNTCYKFYDPTLSDPVKEPSNKQAFETDAFRFLRLWGRIAPRCPASYADAFLSLALPSLYPYAHYRVSQPYLETGLQKGVLTEPFGQMPMVSPSRFSDLRNFLNRTIWETGADRIPVLSTFMNTGVLFWTLLFLFLFVLYLSSDVSVLLLPFLLYGTFLLGPVMQGRYAYPFVCSLPLFFYTAFSSVPRTPNISMKSSLNSGSHHG